MDRLRVTNHSTDIVEYRVLHPSQLSLINAAIAISLFGSTAYLFTSTHPYWLRWLLVLLTISYVIVILTHPVSQSMSIIPPHGIQLSSHTVLARRVDTFLPSHTISDILIHEGFHRFNIRYYLAIVVRSGKSGGPVRIVTPLSDVNPTFKILREVYHATREAIFEEHD